MAITDIADQYFAVEARIASFQGSQQLPKRRASNASSKAPKSLKWPHKFLSGEELAKAGFFFYPTPENPDNVACFLCHKSIDGWVKGDVPVAEHLKHSPECGWAIVATIETQDGELSEENPASSKMIEARRATFADKWPHEHKKGWKCKVKQLVDAGWKYTPSLEYDDMATCTYCNLALDGWENTDKPLDEHFARSPECPFFILMNNSQQAAGGKKAKANKGRASKASRLSTQSSFTVASASEAASFLDLPAGEGDSILTTATAATSQGKKMAKGKKATAAKGRKIKVKKDEEVEAIPASEPEYDNSEVKVDATPPKANRGKKRKSVEVNDTTMTEVEDEAPAPKRRNTRTRGSTAVENSTLEITVTEADATVDAKPPKAGRKNGRGSVRKSSRKVSTASVASTAPLRAAIPDDDEIDKALLADLERPLTDDEETAASAVPLTKPTRSSKITKADHAMFGTQAIDIDEAAIDAELEAMEVESRSLPSLPKAKGAKGKQPRKVSAKKQAAARKAAEAKVAAQQAAEDEDEASQQMATELEHSVSVQQSSPDAMPRGRKAGSRQASRQRAPRDTRVSEISLDVIESNVSLGDASQGTDVDMRNDSGNETDASMASQSTVVRGGGKTRRGSTLKKGKKGKSGKKGASRNIEEIVHQSQPVPAQEEVGPSPGDPSGVGEDDNTAVETQDTEAVQEPADEVLAPKAKPAKTRGRPAKAAPVPEAQEIIEMAPSPSPARTRTPILPKLVKVQTPRAPSPTPPPKEAAPTPSPQSSDAENQPPSSKPSATATKTVTATPGRTLRVPLVASTPQMSPSKRNIIAGLQSDHPWTAVDLDIVFMKSPANENVPRIGLLDEALDKAKNGELTSPEKRMSVEEWIQYNANSAEEKFRGECERMVGVFEKEGGRAMRALEGIVAE